MQVYDKTFVSFIGFVVAIKSYLRVRYDRTANAIRPANLERAARKFGIKKKAVNQGFHVFRPLGETSGIWQGIPLPVMCISHNSLPPDKTTSGHLKRLFHYTA